MFSGWEPKMLDRRSLLVAGASSLVSIMLPRVPGTSNAFILPFTPTEAFADEEDPFKVLVLSRTMFGVVVVDVANKMNPIAGAQVTLTSRYAAGKQLTATTDDEGTAIFEIAPLSEGYVDEATLLDAYDFNGGISISMPGYRDVEIPLARIQGGTAITAPTRPLSDGEPYFRQLTFDEWDIQYADATFMAMPKDDAANAQPDTHAFTVQAHLPQGGQATLHINKVMPAVGSSPETVTQIGQVKASATGTDNLATFALEDKFLDAASGLLEEGCKLRFVLDYQGKTYTLSSPMGVATAPASKAESGSTTIVPTTMDQEITPFDFPAAFPGIGGNKFTCWMPTFPILFDFSFAGYVLFGGGYKPASYMNDSGNPDPEYWKKSPRESGAKQANRYLDEMEGKWNQYKSMSAGSGTDPRNTKLLRHHCTLLFTMDIATQVYGSLAYDWVGKTWGDNNDPAYGNIKALFQVKTDLNWTEQFTLGPVPFFLNVNPWVLAKLALAVGAHTHGSGAAFFKNISLDYSNTSGSFTIQIGLAVTFGAGVAGVASSAVRGAASLTVFIGYEKADGHPLPRLRVGADVDVDVILQFVMFKWTTKAWSGSWPTLADSWNMSVNNGDQYVLQRSELALGGDTPYTLDAYFGAAGNAESGGVPQFIASATIVTNAELLACAEVAATPVNVAPVVRDWEQTVTHIELDADAESDDTGQVEHFIHALMENGENAAPMYKYTYIGQATNAVADPSANSAGVSEDERGGIKPSGDNVLFTGVLSEAHMKFAEIAGVECLFRIASVRYGEDGRSRLVVHTKANGVWSAPMPVDFPLGFGEGDVERGGTFDYDFDVVEYTDGRGNQDAYVLLVSGERPEGDATRFDTASTAGILSVLRLRISNSEVRVVSHTSWRSISRGRLHEDGYHCLQCPRITVGKTLVDGRLSGAYLHRRGATAEKALGSEAEVALECFTLWSDVSGDSLTFRQVLRFPQAPSSIELGVPENVNGKMVVPVAYETASGCGCASYAVIGQSIAGWGVMSPDASVPRVVPWPQHTGFLATVDERLQHVTWTRGASAFATTPIGAAGCGPASFSMSNNGRCVLYVENTDGKVGQTYDEEGKPVAVMGKHFRIIASTLIDDLFTEPFVLCELEHPIDQITTFLTSGGMLSALATHIVSAEQSKAELHGIEVPLVACATPLGAIANLGAVVPGAASESFTVTVRNDGNTLLTAGTIDLYREGSNQPFSSASIGFGANARMASIYDPELAEDASANDMAHVKYTLEALGERFATHPLVADNGNAVLAPGCTAQFRMSFAIPESWGDEVGKRVTLYAKARDLVALDPVTLEEIRPGANSALSAVLHELHIPDAACERAEVLVGVSGNADTTGLHDAPMTADGDGGSSGGGPGTGGSSGGSGSGSGKDRSNGKRSGKAGALAGTGDSNIPLTAAAAALAAAGAGLVAYSARRTALERSGSDEADTDGSR